MCTPSLCLRLKTCFGGFPQEYENRRGIEVAAGVQSAPNEIIGSAYSVDISISGKWNARNALS